MTSADMREVVSAANRQRLEGRQGSRRLMLFFGATFLWTWAFYAPIVIGRHSAYEMPWAVLLVLGGMGPSLVGIGLVAVTFDRDRRRDFWVRCTSVRRIPLRWWGVIVLTFPIVFGLSLAAVGAAGGSPPGMTELRDLIASPALLPLVVLVSLLSGPVSEELGWRGFALDGLLGRWGAVVGSSILGLAWGLWHLPLYFMADTWHAQMGFGLSGLWSFVILSVGLSLLMTGAYIGTGGSILAAVLLHFASNFTAQLVGPYDDGVEVVRSVLVVAVGLTAIVVATRTRPFGSRWGHDAPDSPGPDGLSSRRQAPPLGWPTRPARRGP